MSGAGWSEHPRVVGLRRRSAPANTLVRAIDSFRRHRTGRNAALIAHYGFLSVFPLLLVFTTVLGFVLESRPKLRQTIIDSALARLPFIGQQIADDPGRIKGNALVLVLGLLASLWAGMRAFNGLQGALDDIADVPLDERGNLFRTRLRSLIGIGIVGAAQIAAAALTALVGMSGLLAVHKVMLTLAALALNTVVLATMYRWLCVRPQRWRQVAPGAVAAGVVFAALQLTGTTIVGRAIANASPVYGTFATVIGLLTWLSLHSMTALLGAEVNHVLPARRFSD